jgi:hypothetical protein
MRDPRHAAEVASCGKSSLKDGHYASALPSWIGLNIGFGKARIFLLRHAELVSASMACALVQHRVEGKDGPWTLKQVQGDGTKEGRGPITNPYSN